MFRHSRAGSAGTSGLDLTSDNWTLSAAVASSCGLCLSTHRALKREQCCMGMEVVPISALQQKGPRAETASFPHRRGCYARCLPGSLDSRPSGFGSACRSDASAAAGHLIFDPIKVLLLNERVNKKSNT